MSEESKEEVVVEQEVAVTEEVKNESPEKVEEPKVEDAEKVEDIDDMDDNSDIFITEKDRFDIPIEYYMVGNDPSIKGFDDDYDDKHEKIKKFTITFKHPSQKDADAIVLTNPIEDIEKTTYNEFLQLENLRILVLIRTWTLKKDITEIAYLHPKMIKAIRLKVTEEIGGNGIY